MRTLAGAAVMLVLAGLGVASAGQSGTPSRHTTDHLDVVTSAPETAVVPGSRLALVLDVRPADRMHIYAPPQEDYIPIELQLDPVPDLTVHSMTYPEAEEYYFEPLDEWVMVYKSPFRLVQEVTLADTPEIRARVDRGETIAIRGRLRYQACDDRLCYLPRNVPVSWTFELRPAAR